MEIKKLTSIEDFKSLRVGDELIVVWNDEGEIWDREMNGKKFYKILKIQRASTKSKYPDEIILRKKANIFFNFRLFVNGESKVVKEVYAFEQKTENGR